MNTIKTISLVLVTMVLASCQTTRVQELENETALLAQKNQNLATKVDELVGELGTLKASKGTLVQTRDELSRDRDALLAKVGGLEARINELQTTAVSAEARATEFKAKIALLNEENGTLTKYRDSTRADLQAELDRLLKKIENLNVALTTAQAEKVRLEGQLQEGQVKLEEAASRLRQQLKVEIDRGNLEVLQYQNVLIVNIKDSLLFAPDSPVLKNEYRATLGTIAQSFRQFPDKVIRVEGHTTTGLSRWSSSWELGAARAVSVVEFFQYEQKIDPSSLVVVSFGQYRPLVPNDTDLGRTQNRRVQLVLVDRPLYQVQELLGSSGAGQP